MKPGTQIAYVPCHAEGDVNHPDVEFGFVTSEQEGFFHFCRYWYKNRFGELRTKANSELTPTECLVKYESVSQALVDELLGRLKNGG